MKGKLAAILEEDEGLVKPPAKPVKPEKKNESKAGVGRPAKVRKSKACTLHIPLDLLDKIEAAAGERTAGNKSVFVTQVLEAWFEK